VRIKGVPSPKQYVADSSDPRAALALSIASVCTAASAGPIHGVHPNPKRKPKNGAPISPLCYTIEFKGTQQINPSHENQTHQDREKPKNPRKNFLI
jgi:hypothetical protein